jgi:hypothetical protein
MHGMSKHIVKNDLGKKQFAVDKNSNIESAPKGFKTDVKAQLKEEINNEQRGLVISGSPPLGL